MIFQRALRRELVSTAGAVFTTLFTITITIMLIRVLGQAAGGSIASQDVIALMGFAALNYLPVILILTGFISILLVITRSYADSEMVVWFASGLSLLRWVTPIMQFGLPIVALTAALSFYATPWANRQSAEFKERFQKRDDISKVTPGKFQESAKADRVFFVEAIANDATKVRNIFVNSIKDGRNSVIVAKEGTVDVDSRGDKFLVMSQGRRYDGMPNDPEFRMMEFQRYGVLVARQATALVGDTSARSLPTTLLLAIPSDVNKGEFLWRLSLPLMCLLLMLLAVPLGFVNPRAGRSANLMIALLLAVAYSNMVSVFQAAVAQGRMSFWLAWWPIHIAALLTIVVAFIWRLTVNSAYHPANLWGALKRTAHNRKARA